MRDRAVARMERSEIRVSRANGSKELIGLWMRAKSVLDLHRAVQHARNGSYFEVPY